MYVVPDLGVGGAERHVTTLMPNLDRDRFEPAVVCIGAEGALFADLAETDVPSVAFGRSKRQALPALTELVREFRRFAPDVVITRGYNAELLGRVAAIITGVRHNVMWVHNCGDTEPRTKARRIADRILDRWTSAYFGVARTQISYMVDDLHYPERKIDIIYNGVDPSLFDTGRNRSAVTEFGIAESSPVVGILAAMRPEKDHANFLAAARRVLSTIPDAKFLVVGDGPERAHIEATARDLGVDDSVVFTGSRSDVAALLAAMDVFVLSSYSVECFPMALLEAMACGLPAVCTAVGGVPEMIDDGVTGFLVRARDADALGDKLVEILSDRSVLEAMGKAARSRVESEFSLATSVAAAESALERLVGSAPSSPKRPIRLTVVLDLTFVGGAEVLLLNLFKTFDPAVVTPRLVCIREAGPLADDFRAAGFEVTVLPRRGKLGLGRIPRLVKAFREDDTDAVMVMHHHRAALALGPLAARAAGVPARLVAAHDMDLTSVGKRVLPKWAVSELAVSNSLVLLSPAQGEYLRREEGVGRRPWQSIRETVIPNGISLPPVRTEDDRRAARALLQTSDSTFVVGIVARLSEQKAHHVLFEAFARATTARPDSLLVVVGTGEREAELRALANTLNISDRTRFLGVRRDVSELLPGLDVSCLSSVHEGVPLILIESMAAGVPVVATDCGSVADIVTDGEQGFVVPVGDVAAFSDRLTLLASDRSLAQRLGSSGRSRAETEFSIADTARKYERLLTELVAKGRAHV
ncbi:glycosyltransferase [Nocardiaceae bacterium YC2-7]|uniref:Glycosyltransferase n=2 Tax=Antrihabitans stalactiti TaxID=2584121 RepID=A0A848KFY3_9NOCA|nr:glycosyltransferase [Antrihabitans stalactiti]NMN96666.1 glycosyltransferase [Antrihabitans stalactiti]